MRLSSNKAVLVAVLVIAICAQLFWVFWPRLNLLADPYRHAERQKALREWGQQRTPESKAVLDREHQLLDDHLRHTAFLMIAAAVIECAVVVFIVRRSVLSHSHANTA